MDAYADFRLNHIKIYDLNILCNDNLPKYGVFLFILKKLSCVHNILASLLFCLPINSQNKLTAAEVTIT